jgi:hypothetical protein
LASRSSVACSGRSSVFIQTSLAKLDMMLDSCAQNLRPSLYRSYAVELRNERHRPTTKPAGRQVSLVSQKSEIMLAYDPSPKFVLLALPLRDQYRV